MWLSPKAAPKPREGPTVIDRDLVNFECTSCGRCCKEPLLPLTDVDVKRIITHTGLLPSVFVIWVSPRQIDLSDQPEAFVELRSGRRLMAMRQGRLGCHFLSSDQRCTIYDFRPTGCRVFPFDAEFSRTGRLVRLERIPATDCQSTRGKGPSLPLLRENQRLFDDEVDAYHEKVRIFNREQRRRRRHGLLAEPPSRFLGYLGLLP